MDKKTKFEIIAVGISAFALIISGWVAITTKSNQETTIEIQQNSLRMQENIYNANKPFLNPIIYVKITDFDVNITHGIDTDVGLINEDTCTTWKFNISLEFNNYGNGIAHNTTFMVVMCDLININWVDLIGASISANDIYPDTPQNFPVFAEYSNCHLGDGVIYHENISDKVGFIVKSEYYDKISGERLNQTYWFKYVISQDILYDLTIVEKNLLLDRYEEKYNQNFLEMLTLSPQ